MDTDTLSRGSFSASAPASSPGSLRRGLRLLGERKAALVIACGAAPFLILMVQLLRHGAYANWGDNALLEMQTRDVGRHFVALGPYSRFGFSHPGPALFYAFAIPYWIAGGNATGLNLGTLLINGAAFVGIAWIAWRRGGMLLLCATLLALELFMRQVGVGPDFIRQPWNPYVTVLPLGCLLYVAWEIARGERWALPVGFGIASFLVQTHLGFLPVVGLVGGAALVLGWRTYRMTWRGTGRPALRRALIVTAGLAVGFWTLPVVYELSHWPGNVASIASFQMNNSPDHGLVDGIALVLRYTANFPAWALGRPLGGDGTFPGTAWYAVPALVVFAVSLFVAWRRRAGNALRFAVIIGVAWLAAVISVSRVVGPLYEYIVRWIQMPTLALLSFPFVVASDPAVRTRRVGLYRAVGVVVALVMAGVTLANITRTLTIESPGGLKEPEVVALTAAVRRAIPRDVHTVVFGEGTTDSYADEFGVATELERAGYTVRFPGSYANEVGVRRAGAPASRYVRVVFVGEKDRARVAGLPGARELGAAAGVAVFQVD